MSLMGVDIGITGVKAVAFGEDGDLLSSAYEEYPLLFPSPGARELDPRRVIEAASRVIEAAASEVKGTEPVKAIGIASQGEAFTPVMPDGRMIGNAMIFSDARCQPLVNPWSESFGEERAYRITGHIPYSMYSLFKFLWLKEHQPDVWETAWKFLFFQDLLASVLTSETKTDYTMAARTMMFDITKKQWSPEIMETVGLSPDRLPEVVPSGEIVGTVKREAASKLGLGSGVTVSVCGHDQPVGALGCGAAVPGRASYSIGTVECICAAVDRPIMSAELMKANLVIYPHVVPDTYTTQGFNATGGSVLKWVRDNFAVEEAEEARRNGEDPYDRIIAAASTEPADVILLPHFGPTGTPHLDALGAGVLFGLKLSTSRSEVLRAVLEGITYEMKWNLAILGEAGFGLTELRAIGGGARSETWMQIKADILGIPLTTMRVTESTCMGAAILAGRSTGITGESWAVPIKTFEPRKEYASLYEERFAIYREVYASLGKAREMLSRL
jgi:xylulokinase